MYIPGGDDERATRLTVGSGCHLSAALRTSNIYSSYHVKTLDLLIATYALAHGAPLLTLDKEFRSMCDAGIPLTLA